MFNTVFSFIFAIIECNKTVYLFLIPTPRRVINYTQLYRTKESDKIITLLEIILIKENN